MKQENNAASVTDAELLHGLLFKQLLAQLRASPTHDAAFLNVVRQSLRDNNISVNPVNDEAMAPVRRLADAARVPFRLAEED